MEPWFTTTPIWVTSEENQVFFRTNLGNKFKRQMKESFTFTPSCLWDAPVFASACFEMPRNWKATKMINNGMYRIEQPKKNEAWILNKSHRIFLVDSLPPWQPWLGVGGMWRRPKAGEFAAKRRKSWRRWWRADTKNHGILWADIKAIVKLWDVISLSLYLEFEGGQCLFGSGQIACSWKGMS